MADLRPHPPDIKARVDAWHAQPRMRRRNRGCPTPERTTPFTRALAIAPAKLLPARPQSVGGSGGGSAGEWRANHACRGHVCVGGRQASAGSWWLCRCAPVGRDSARQWPGSQRRQVLGQLHGVSFPRWPLGCGAAGGLDSDHVEETTVHGGAEQARTRISHSKTSGQPIGARSGRGAGGASVYHPRGRPPEPLEM